MIRKFLVVGVATLSLNSCAQKKNDITNESSEIFDAPLDFVKNNGDLKYVATSKGVVKFKCYHGFSDASENPFGNAYVYMIHKNGGNWWYNKAKENYPDKHFPHNFFARQLYETKDSITLKDYYKWAFFIDKKYLKQETAGGGEADVVFTSYIETYPYTVILYEQRPYSNKWMEIDRKTFLSEKEYYEKGWDKWESNFYKRELQKLNEKYSPR